jgi:superfamily II DNA or RNA helicase
MSTSFNQPVERATGGKDQKMSWQFLRHQQELIEKSKEVLSGTTSIKRIISHIVPGHGKSCSGPILASYLIPARFDRICWIVPRSSLQEQAETVFLDTNIRNALGHSHKIRLATNQINPCRGHIGYATTYQAIAQDGGGTNRDEFERHRYCLILDEPQHLELDDSWHRSIQPLYDRASFIMMMSGELARGDNKRVAFLPYKNVAPGKWSPDLTNTEDTYFIQSSIEEALRERKITKTFFEQLDGDVRFMNKEGKEQKEVIGNAAKADNFKVVWGALNTEYAFELLNACLVAYRKHRRENPRAKMLVVSPNIGSAEKYRDWLGNDLRVGIATSDDNAAAADAIRAFKAFGPKSLDILVTVAMAYEGLDVPAITHIASLTHIRSKPWIYQMIARGWRTDYQSVLSYQEQKCVVYCPNDQLMRECIDRIKKAMLAVICEGHQVEGREGGEMEYIVPLSSHAFGGESTDIDTDESITGDEWLYLYDLRSKFHAEDVPILEFKRLLSESQKAPPPSTQDLSDLPPSLNEKQIRKRIEAYSRQWCRRQNQPDGTLNGILKAQFGKGRDDMEMPELQRAWAWMVKNYPLT